MRRLLSLGTASAAAIAIAVACDSSSGGGGSKGASADDARELLGHLAQDVYVPAVKDFTTTSATLRDAAMAWGANQADDAALADARGAWRDAMASWQILEVMQLGPALPPERGGQDLRALIYSWPTTSLCLIDQRLATEAYAGEDFVSGEGVNARGLDALEYLLFYEGDETTCPNTVEVVSSGAWDAAVTAGLRPRRAAYAALLAKDVAKQASTLNDAWKSFARELSTAGAASTTFDMTQDALNAVTDALFYLDTETKTMKLGEPSGRADGCGYATCPDDVEHPFAAFSKRAIAQNLVGAARVFRGDCDDDAAICGVFDLLRAVGAKDLASRLNDALKAATSTVDAIEPELAEALRADAPEPGAAYDALRELTVLMKTEMLSILDLSPPLSAADDSD